MPLYEYQCQECGTEFELIARYHEADDPQLCPHCESSATSRKVTTSFASSLSSYSVNSSSSCSSGGRFT